jgi:2-(1,2-epoxy-1,2-dihydrophenyl)acetyl-CoA isomerase
MENPVIRLSVQEGIARVVLNRPDEGNPISDAFVHALEQVTLTLTDRSDLRAVLISSTGPRFSVGGDIEEFTADLENLSSNIRRWNGLLNASVARLARMDAPSVVAVQGTVAGGALSLIAGCDIIVAANTAQFAAAYASIGYCPDLGGTISLARRIGLARARRFHLLHERLDATTAERIGLVDFVVGPGEVAARAEEIVVRWSTGPTLAYGEIRRLMQSADHTPLETQLEYETQGIVALARREDAWNALKAFLDKREPVYSGR